MRCANSFIFELPSFAGLGVDVEDLEELAFNSSKNGGNGSKPRPMSQGDYLTLIKSLMSSDL
jgi:hypothetical protein